MGDSAIFKDNRAGVTVKVTAGTAGLKEQIENLIEENGPDEEVCAIIQDTGRGTRCTGYLLARDTELVENAELFEDEHFERMMASELLAALSEEDAET